MRKPIKKRKPAMGARAIHTDGQRRAALLADLKVVIVKDDDGWFYAQGLDIDYGAQGQSLEEVKRNFADGFAKTIRLHIQRFGTVEKLLRPASQEVWREFARDWAASRMRYSGANPYKLDRVVSKPARAQLPYQNIRYIEPSIEAR